MLRDVSSAFDHLRTGISVFDHDDRLTYCNDHFRYLFRSVASLQHILGLGYRELIETLVTAREFAGNEVINDPDGWIENRLALHHRSHAVIDDRLSDGRWIQVKERPTESGGVISIWNDITGPKRHLAYLEGAMDCIADGFAIWDQRGRLYQANRQFSERYGGSSHRLDTGDRMEDVISHIAGSGTLDASHDAVEWLSGMMSTRALPERTVDIRFNDDRDFILTERRTKEGGVVSTLTDVTELKQKERDLIFRGQSLEQAISELEMVNDTLERQGAELANMAEQIDATHGELEAKRQALAIAEARQRAILETMVDGLVVLDDRGRIETLNPNAEKMLGICAADVLGRALVEFVQIEDDDQLIGDIPAYLIALQELEGDSRREFVIRMQNGNSLSVEGAFSTAEAGSQRYTVITLRDISKRKAAEVALIDSHEMLERRVEERTRSLTDEIRQREETEKALLQAKREAELANWAKSQFLANMSHELRTPLNCIIGFSDMLKHQYFGPIGNLRYIEYASDISQSGSHLLGVINDILDVSRIELGEFELDEHCVDIRQIIDACVTMIDSKAQIAGIAVQKSIPRELPRLIGDERRIKQAVLNLLSNGVKFTRPGGDIRIECQLDEESSITVIVEDTGVGISEHDIERVLHPFAQVGDSHTRGYEGTGLGLSITKSLTELHGGHLHMESTIGKGTRVTLRFPASRTSNEAKSPA